MADRIVYLGAVWGKDGWGDGAWGDNGNVSVVGTGAIGTVTFATDEVVVPTGVVGTGAIGTVGFILDENIVPIGVVGTGAVGTAVPSYDWTVYLGGAWGIDGWGDGAWGQPPLESALLQTPVRNRHGNCGYWWH